MFDGHAGYICIISKGCIGALLSNTVESCLSPRITLRKILPNVVSSIRLCFVENNFATLLVENSTSVRRKAGVLLRIRKLWGGAA